MATASDTGYATPEDSAAALSALSDADLLRLKRFAQYRTLGLPQVDPLDLIHDAIDRVLSGRRRWPREVPFVLFLQQTMRSLAHDHWRRRAEGRVVTLADLDAGQTLAYDAAADASAPAPDERAETRDLVAAVYGLFAKDPTAQKVLDGLAEGLSPTEIMAGVVLSATAFASLRRKIRRTVDQAVAEGKLPDVRL